MKKFGVAVVVFTALLFISSSLSSSPTEELEGTLEIIMATEVGKKSCEPLYSINVNGKRTQFSLPVRVPPLSPGQKIKISGRWEEVSGKKSFHCRKITPVATTAPVAKRAISSADSASDYLPRQRPVLGEQRTLVVLLRFTNHTAPEWGKDKAENKVFASEPTEKYPNDHSDNAFLKECSSEKTWLDGECLDGWKDIPYPATDYGYDSVDELDFLYKLETDAINAIDPYVDYTKYDHILFLRTGSDWDYLFSTLGSKTITTDDGEVSVSLSFVAEDIALDSDHIAHELVIHGILGLIHANNIDISTGEINEYGDRWDNRGAPFALIDCLHKYMTGLLNIDQIILIESSGEYWLDQRELNSSGVKLLVIFLGYDENGEPILYYLEYFKELGEFDSQVFDDYGYDPDENKDVVLLRKYKRENTYDSVVFVTNGRGGYKIKALDIESQEFCDSDYENLEEGYGVCVQVLEKTETDAGQAKVKITLTSDYSFPTPIPKPTPTPCKADIISIPSGGSMNIKKKTSGKVTVEVTSANGCAVEGETVKAIVTSASGQKRIAVSPLEGETDENGRAVFTITAGKKTGKALVSFQASNLETLLTVKISRK